MIKFKLEMIFFMDKDEKEMLEKFFFGVSINEDV